ncbi:MAG: hypothetical protein HC923_01085 [Myxococcales bacterium]|nr:hypothetical protein [Myxococcales bacterium]
MSTKPVLYLIGSLRNPNVPIIAEQIRKATGVEVFDDWYAAGEKADDAWKSYEQDRGHDYITALDGHAANHVFEYDRMHLHRATMGLLVLPAGRSGHLEFGYIRGRGFPAWILLEPPDESAKLPSGWDWLAGIYEGEGSITRNGRRGGCGMQLTVTMKDRDIIERLRMVAGVGTVEGPYRRTNPKWADMHRWSVRRREDVLYVLNGIWENLGTRRRQQANRVLQAAGVTVREQDEARTPHEYRFDVMYKFASGIFTRIEDVIVQIDDAATPRDFIE